MPGGNGLAASGGRRRGLADTAPPGPSRRHPTQVGHTRRSPRRRRRRVLPAVAVFPAPPARHSLAPLTTGLGVLCLLRISEVGRRHGKTGWQGRDRPGGGRGLGRAYARRLAALGAKIAICDLSLKSSEEFEAESRDMTRDSTVAEIEGPAAPLSGLNWTWLIGPRWTPW